MFVGFLNDNEAELPLQFTIIRPADSPVTYIDDITIAFQTIITDVPPPDGTSRILPARCDDQILSTSKL